MNRFLFLLASVALLTAAHLYDLVERYREEGRIRLPIDVADWLHRRN